MVKEDGSPLSDKDAILRYGGYLINTIVMFIGWIAALFDAKGQGWHDKIAKTIVIKS